MTTIPRGERNNNPGNLRFNPAIPWEGLGDPPQDEGGYCRFTTAASGIRAAARDLHSKWLRGLRSVTAIIAVYAPPAENDTAAYVVAVAERLRCRPDAPLDLDDEKLLRDFVTAVIVHENGRCSYPPEIVAAAVAAALPKT